MPRIPVIETSNLVIGYANKGQKRKIVHDSLQLQLFSGELTSLLGLNGAGKSTLLRTLCGFQPTLGGEIRINGRILSDYSHSELSRIIGVVLTEKTNTGGISVNELVALGRHPYTGFFGQLNAKDKNIVEESLKAVDMLQKARSHVSELSDGERQKVMIAKVLAQQCPIIVLDEPTAYLDVTSRIETMSLLHYLALEHGKAILLSTHDLDLAIQMSDCLWLQQDKRQIVCGAPEDLILNGSFETFFDRKGISFDRSTGKLAADKPTRLIAVEGDVNTSFWVGNALIRNGFSPSSADKAEVIIYCDSPEKLILSIPGKEKQYLNSVDKLIYTIRKLKV